MKRDEQAAEDKKRQDEKEERLEKEREATRKREEKAAKEKNDILMAAILANKASEMKQILQLTAPLTLNNTSRLATLRDKVKSARRRLRGVDKKRDRKSYNKYFKALERALGRYKDEKDHQAGNENRVVPHGQKPEPDDNEEDKEDKEVKAKPAKKSQPKKD